MCRTWLGLTKWKTQIVTGKGVYKYNSKNISYSPFEFCSQYMLGQALQTLLVTTFIAQLPSLFIVILVTKKNKPQNWMKN